MDECVKKSYSQQEAEELAHDMTLTHFKESWWYVYCDKCGAWHVYREKP